MLNRLRKYLTTGAVLIGIALLSATAFAVAGDKKAKSVDEASALLEASEVESPEAETEGAGEEGGGLNHGHCVSYWAHAAKEAGLKGKDRGHFVSSVAQDETAVSAKLEGDATPEGPCGTYQADLDEVVAAQAADSDAEEGDEAGEEESGASNASHGKGKGKGNRD